MHNREYEIALENCHRESVANFQTIQGFAALLILDISTLQIKGYSENICSVLNRATSPELGQPLGRYLQIDSIEHSIRGAITAAELHGQRESLLISQANQRPLTLSISTAPEVACVEIEPEGATQASTATINHIIADLSKRQPGVHGVDALVQNAARNLRKYIPYSRCMLYRFSENGDGEVIGESIAPDQDSYLGLRYPASDIPDPVRKIMLKTPSRCIADIDLEESAIITSSSQHPYDLTKVFCRGVSPIHKEYMRNMGSFSSLTYSIVIYGKLWGMIVFHDCHAKTPTSNERHLLELYGSILTLELQSEIELEKLHSNEKAEELLHLVESAKTHTDILNQEFLNQATAAFGACGCASLFEGRWLKIGETPSDPDCERIRSHSEEPQHCSHHIQIDLPDFGNTSIGGYFGMRIDQDHFFIVFRPCIVKTLKWAGQSEKKYTTGKFGPRLTPRGSFGVYKQQISTQAEPWSDNDRTYLGRLLVELVKLGSEHHLNENLALKKQKDFQNLLIAELNHRVRNTLAIVASIARRAATETLSITEYVESLESRIQALVNAHRLMTKSGSRWVALQEIISQEAMGFMGNHKMDVPNLGADNSTAPMLCLFFHELFSNAMKHGALSNSSGSLSINVKHNDQFTTLIWQEECTSENYFKPKTGFGHTLVTRIIPEQIGGESTIDFGLQDLTITLKIPRQSINLAYQKSAGPVGGQPSTDINPSHPIDLSKFSVLIVEDNSIIAHDLFERLSELTPKKIVISSTLQQARQAIKGTHFHIVLLDINLGPNSTSLELIPTLEKAQTKILLITGYDSQDRVLMDLQLPRLLKPVRQLELEAALRALIETPQTPEPT